MHTDMHAQDTVRCKDPGARVDCSTGSLSTFGSYAFCAPGTLRPDTDAFHDLGAPGSPPVCRQFAASLPVGPLVEKMIIASPKAGASAGDTADALAGAGAEPPGAPGVTIAGVSRTELS